jgi:cobalt-zinc-cadmium efflux system membrane fusion protein
LRFTADGADRPIDARIDWISTEVDEQTRTVQVRAQVDNPVVSRAPNGAEQRLLRANTFGTARICVREHAEAAVIPRECLQWDHDGYVVFVQTSERRFRMVRVERGIAHDGEVEIVGEVKPGAMVVRHGSHLLKSKTLLDRLANAAP